MGMAKNMKKSADYALLYRWLANVYSQNDNYLLSSICPYPVRGGFRA